MTTTTKTSIDRNTTAGRFLIATASGASYIADLDNGILTRTPGVNEPTGDHITVDMRHDGDETKLLRVHRCIVGEPATFIIDLGIEGIASTLRRTTPVVSIESVDVDATVSRLLAENTPA